MLTPSHLFFMKYSKTTTDKAQITYGSPFPHRTLKKSLPKIHDKAIPIHFYEDHRQYQGEVNELFMMDQWAYIPIKPHRRSEQHRSHTEGIQIRSKKWPNYSNNFRSTSQVFLKKYLKRKQQKQRRETDNMTNYAGSSVQKKSNAQSNYLQGIIKFNNSRLEKYKTEPQSIQKSKQTIIEQPKNYIDDDIAEFKSEKMQLKQKLKVYDTNIKNKRFEIKIADKRYKHILHSFEHVSKQ